MIVFSEHARLLRQAQGASKNMMERGSPKRLFGRVGVAIAGLAITGLLVSCGDRQALHAGPMLQDVRTNSVAVVWWHNSAESAALTLRAPDGQLRSVPAHRVGNRFEARIDGLQPATTYRYWVQCGPRRHDNPRIPGRLRTAPISGVPYSFLVFGDSGGGKSSQSRLAAVMNRHPVEIVLHTGDVVYPKGELRDYPRNFFRPYRTLLASAPFYPVLGNHDRLTDNGGPFLDTFSLPTNGPSSVQPERCYWFDYGDARYVGIDSNLDAETLANAVVPWLGQVLQSSSLMWRFVFFHHAPWGGGSRPPDAKIRDILVPAIEAGRTDVVFCGHNHLYERTHPLRAGQVVPTNGVRYVTSGAGGKSLHEEKHGAAPHLAAFNDTKFSFTLVTINGSRLELVQISEDDRILDKMIVNKEPAHDDRRNAE